MNLTLGEVIFRQSDVDIFAGPPSFHRLTVGELCPKPEALFLIPGIREEPWAPAFHERREPVHDLGIYIGVSLTVVGDGFLFTGNEPIFQFDIVVPYIRPFAESQVPKTLVEETRPVVVAYDRGFKTYGHFLVDFLPRLLIAERMLGPDFGGALVLLPIGLPDWGKVIFDLVFPYAKTITFDSNVSSLRLSRAILPTHCHKYYMFHPYAQFLFQTLVSKADPIVPAERAEFLMLSRKDLYSNRVTAGMEEIEEYAVALGATILNLQSISWRHQLGYMKAAKLVVGEYGSALHNTVFCGEGIRTLSINRLQFLQSFIGALNKQRLTYVLPASTVLIHNVQTAIFDQDEIKRALASSVRAEFGSETLSRY